MKKAAGSMSDHDDNAARWAIRLDGELLSDIEQRELQMWLEGDERRAGALLRAEAAIAYLDRGRALASPIAQNENLDDGGMRARVGRRGFLAASLGGLAAALVGYSVLDGSPEAIETALGEVRRVPLADGSIASVNTASRIGFAMHEARREVKLERGEAWFQVAHDKTRPFIVAAGDVRVQAIGTAFSVRRRDDGVDVLVTEGVVEAWVVGHEMKRTRIPQGSISFIADLTSKIAVSEGEEEIERALAWRTGELVLNGQTLAYAAAELNRYNKQKLIIDDPQLGREALVGYFRTEQPEIFARAAGAMLDADVRIEGDVIHLTRP